MSTPSLTLQASQSRGRAGSHSPPGTRPPLRPLHKLLCFAPQVSRCWHRLSLVAARGLSCPKTRGVSAGQGWSLCPAFEQADSYPLDRQEVPPTWKHWVSSHYGSREVLEECNFRLQEGAVMASTSTTPRTGRRLCCDAEEREASRLWTGGCTEKGRLRLTLTTGRDSAAREKGVLACRELNF